MKPSPPIPRGDEFPNPIHQRIYEAGCEQIARTIERNHWDEHGCLSIPFSCHWCQQTKVEVGLVTDKVPVCADCWRELGGE